MVFDPRPAHPRRNEAQNLHAFIRQRFAIRRAFITEPPDRPLSSFRAMRPDLHLARVEERRARAISARHLEFHFRKRTFLQARISAHAQFHRNLLRVERDRSIEVWLLTNWRKYPVRHPRIGQIEMLLQWARHRERNNSLRRKNARAIARSKEFMRRRKIND